MSVRSGNSRSKHGGCLLKILLKLLLSLKNWKIAIEKFSITMPLKVHIICHHLSDFFSYTGQTLRKVNDQVAESAHHKVKMFFESRPNYNHQNKETLSSGEATLAGIIHFNSINI